MFKQSNVLLVKMPHSWNYRKLSHKGGGVQNFLLERGDKPKNGGGGVDIEIGGLQLFYYFTIQSHLPCVRGK